VTLHLVFSHLVRIHILWSDFQVAEQARPRTPWLVKGRCFHQTVHVECSLFFGAKTGFPRVSVVLLILSLLHASYQRNLRAKIRNLFTIHKCMCIAIVNTRPLALLTTRRPTTRESKLVFSHACLYHLYDRRPRLGPPVFLFVYLPYQQINGLLTFHLR